MGNRRNATKKRNLSKIKNKTSDGDKTQTEIVDYDEKRDSVDVVDAEKSCDKSSGQMNSGEKSVVEVNYIVEVNNGEDTEAKCVNKESCDEKVGRGGTHLNMTRQNLTQLS